MALFHPTKNHCFLGPLCYDNILNQPPGFTKVSSGFPIKWRVSDRTVLKRLFWGWGNSLTKAVSIHWVVATQIFFIFIPKIGEDSNFDEYFSDGLKPPTRYSLYRWGFLHFRYYFNVWWWIPLSWCYFDVADVGNLFPQLVHMKNTKLSTPFWCRCVKKKLLIQKPGNYGFLIFYFHPDPWGNDPILTRIFFQMGWFNRQLGFFFVF